MIKQTDIDGKHVNRWMIDEQFLSTIKFKDVFYLKLLADTLYTFSVKKCPVHVKTKLIGNNIRFNIGKDIYKDFQISNSIHPDDYILWVEQWLQNYYPRYSVEVEKYIPYSEDEKTQIVLSSSDIEKGMKLIERGKKVLVEETMLITRIILLKDKFKVYIDGIPYIYSVRKTKLSKFLSEFRKQKTDEDKAKFFREYTIKVKKIDEKSCYVIDRREDELLSFINIYSIDGSNLYQTGEVDIEGNFREGKNGSFIRWDKYVFKSNSDYVLKKFYDTIIRL